MPYQQSGNTELFYTYKLRLVMLMEYTNDDKINIEKHLSVQFWRIAFELNTITLTLLSQNRHTFKLLKNCHYNKITRLL